MREQVKEVVAVTPGSFEPTAHFYPRVLNAHIHPIVRTFLSLGNSRIAKRYCHLHPEAQPEAVTAALKKVLTVVLCGNVVAITVLNLTWLGVKARQHVGKVTRQK